jgi:hypothetical protein
MVERELAGLVGRENVTSDAAVLKEYSQDNSFAPAHTPSCVVRPANTEEVQAIVKWANEKGVPLIAVSSGPPHFRGDTVPQGEGAVIVDLRRMDRIIRINAANRVALIEPGVTFGQLQEALAREGLSAYLPLAPRSSKSVLTSYLEREPITMPGVHFDSTDPMLCTEIVFGTGDRMRTGEAAGPDPLEKQWEIGKAQISPFGPTQMDPQRLVSGAQGTIGIVSWISLKCRFLSVLAKAFLIPSDRLEPLIELSYKLTRIRFTGSIFILNNLNLAALLRQSSQEIDALRTQLPPWVLFVSCEGYGPLPEEKVEYLEADLKELAAAQGLQPEIRIGEVQASEMASLLVRPSPEPYWKQRYRGGVAELFFLTTQGRTPDFTRLLEEVVRREGGTTEGIGVYIQPVVQGTSCHCEFDFYYDPSGGEARDKTRRIVQAAASEMEASGAFFSRPYGEWSGIAYRQSQDTAGMQRKVKAIFDPNSILNPGKLCFGLE